MRDDGRTPDDYAALTCRQIGLDPNSLTPVELRMVQAAQRPPRPAPADQSWIRMETEGTDVVVETAWCISIGLFLGLLAFVDVWLAGR